MPDDRKLPGKTIRCHDSAVLISTELLVQPADGFLGKMDGAELLSCTMLQSATLKTMTCSPIELHAIAELLCQAGLQLSAIPLIVMVIVVRNGANTTRLESTASVAPLILYYAQ